MMGKRENPQAAYWHSLYLSAIGKQSMCADHIKGDVEVKISWSNGIDTGTTILHSDQAERTVSDAAHAAVANGLIDGDVTLTIKVRKVRT